MSETPETELARLRDERCSLIDALTAATELLGWYAKVNNSGWDGSASEWSVLGKCRAILAKIADDKRVGA
jgi:hypothetical protein